MKTTTTYTPGVRVLLTCALTLLLMCLLATAGFAAGEAFTAPENGIPVVYLNIDESRGSIEDMLTSDNHSLYCYGEVSIDVPEGFHYADFPDAPCESVQGLAMSIRGRGNSTWAKADKKPFKIKLDKKADLFGLGRNKHWVLIANAFDDSLLRDRVTAWLGDEMGFAFTPRGVPVDVVVRHIVSVTLNGKTYTAETENITVPGTATGEPDRPANPSQGGKCKWCGKGHSGFWGGIVGFWHMVVYFRAHLFGRR